MADETKGPAVDPYSDTWRAVTAWAKEERQLAVDRLIGGQSSDDVQRGIIRQIDRLLELANKREEPAIPPEY